MDVISAMIEPRQKPGGSGSSNSTMTAAQTAAQQAAQKAKALLQLNNQNGAGYFAVAMLGLMTIFSVIHWIDIMMVKRQSVKGVSSSALSRKYGTLRSILLRKIPGFTSVGHFVVFLVYMAINVILLFLDTYEINIKNVAIRLGWLASYNVCLVTVLSLKNTPLAFLTSYSYERLNILHQASGYATVLFTVLHGITYIVSEANNGKISELGKMSNVMGEVAGVAMLVMTASALLLRKLRYEIFYSLHIIMFILIIVGMGFHRPINSVNVWTFACFAGGAWILDRMLRFVKIALLNFLGNSARVVSLPHGGLRITLAKTPLLAVPGSHLFLWIPGVRALETHPFTIVGTNPTELVVSAQDGFTRSLYNKAVASQGQLTLRASVDGPYGTLPAFTDFSNIILVAGGTGASFTFGAVNNMIAKSRKTGVSMPRIHFVWVIRDAEYLEWFGTHLESLRECENVKIEVYITRQSGTTSSSSTLSVSSAAEKTNIHVQATDVEKSGFTSEVSSQNEKSVVGVSMRYGRPDLKALIPVIETGMKATNASTLVAACGPKGMMNDVRKCVADEVAAGRPGLRVHTEAFGW